jgi:hypothetical protein
MATTNSKPVTLLNFLQVLEQMINQCWHKYPNELVPKNSNLGTKTPASYYDLVRSQIFWGLYDKEIRPINLACKQLGIPHTYEAIDNILKENDGV